MEKKMQLGLLSLFFLFFLLSSTRVMAEPRFGLILFYRTNCVHCQRFAPKIKAVAARQQLPVLAFSLDGKSLPNFPQTQYPAAAETRQFFPKSNPAVPAVFLADRKTRKIYPVLQGETTQVILQAQIKQLITTLIQQQEFQYAKP